MLIMKKLLLFSALLVITSGISFGQTPASCPYLLNYSMDQVSAGNYELDVQYNNHTGQGVKSIRTTVYDQNGNVCFVECFETLPGINTHTSATFACTNPNAWVFIEIFTGNSQQACSGTSCFNTLPVNISSFEGRRQSGRVSLSWTTSTEQNNRGFYIQRKDGGQWQDIAFVESTAKNGNSNSPISYEFTDVNISRGITQYQLKQKDIDGKMSFSKIIMLRAEGQTKGTIVYPNPSSDGTVNILFGESGSKNVWLYDISGKVIRTWKNVGDDNLQLNALSTGTYSIRIETPASGKRLIKKIVILR